MQGEQQDDGVVHQALEAYVAAFAAARAEHQPGVDFASANARAYPGPDRALHELLILPCHDGSPGPFMAW